MLFVALLKAFPGTGKDARARRLEWENPEGGVRVIGEYWLQTPDPSVVAVVEADHMGQIWATFGGWGDFFELTVYPAVTAEDGLEMMKQMG